MEEHYLKIQKYFMRINQEVELKYLSSTTDDNVSKIQVICSDVKEILRSCDIPVSRSSALGSNIRVISLYKFLILNTNFNSAHKFVDDPVNGHLANMFPSLSKNLFMEMILSLEYESIFIGSILFFPLSLSLELLEISRRFLEKLQPKRRLDFVLSLVVKVYKKFLYWKHRTLESEDHEHELERCLTNFQELLLLLQDPKAMALAGLPVNNRYEKQGIIFRGVLRTSQTCLELEDQTDPDEDFKGPVEESYRMCILGKQQQQRQEQKQLDSNVVETFLEKCRDDLLNLVEKLTKEITMEMYIGWVEFDDPENTCSLQLSIRTDCALFRRYLVSREKQLEKFQDLIQCLEPISLVESESRPSLEQLVTRFQHRLENSLLELLKNYRKFDESVFDVILDGSKDRVYNEQECAYLLDFLALVLRKPEVEMGFKRKVLEFVGQSLFSLSFDVFVKVCVGGIIKSISRQDQDPLDPEHRLHDFEEFLCLNTDFNVDNLRMIYFWMLRDPHGVLKLLLRVLMGHPNFDEVMIVPEEFLHHFRPILELRLPDSETMLTRNLRKLCLEDFPWDSQRLSGFLDLLYGKTRVSLVDRVLLPYLQLEEPNPSNLRLVLTLLRGWLTPALLRQVRQEDLVVALLRASSAIRSRAGTSRSETQESLNAIQRILDSIFSGYALDEEARERVTSRLELNEHRIEPIDWLFYTRRLSVERITPEKSLRVFKIYESKCFAILSRFQGDKGAAENPGVQYLRTFSFLREDFLKHLLLRMSPQEFEKFGLECVQHDYFQFNWTTRAQALENFLRIVFELALVLLQFPGGFPEDAFPFLLSQLVTFARSFIESNANSRVLQTLLENLCAQLRQIRATLDSSEFAHLYDVPVPEIPVGLRDMALQETEGMLLDLLEYLERFVYRCYQSPQSEPQFPGKPFRRSLSHFLAYRLICEFLKVPRTDKSEVRVKVDRLFDEFSGSL